MAQEQNAQMILKVLVEFAHFNPEDIIGRALKYNLKSDAAHKFERFVDPNIHDLALRRFIKIVQDHANLNEVKLYKYTDNKSNRKSWNFRLLKLMAS